MPQKFWMVWLKDSPTTTKRHTSKEGAEKEADRIAMLPGNIGKKVYVLEAIDYRFFEPNPLVKMKL